MITAHGGAEGTSRNSIEYFERMQELPIDAIEVDIRRLGNKYYLGHSAIPFFKKKRILLQYVFEYCLKNGVMVNCDVKNRNLIHGIVNIAQKMGVTHLVYFTGKFLPHDVKYLDDCIAYVNNCFYKKIAQLSIANLPKIKEYIDSFNCENIKGLNINKRFATDDFIIEAKKLGIGLSVYTVDEEDVLKRILSHNVDNITTNIISKAINLVKPN